ncbi:MAG: RNA 2',3'-cyclic phosphodiesterase [Candidatus Hodarchaeales archaeon]
MVRSFICVEITNPTTTKNINDVIAKLQFKSVRTVKPNQLHITLKFLGELTEKKISQVKDKLQEIDFNSFNLHLTGIGTFPNVNYMRVLWIGVKEGAQQLKDLASLVDSKTHECGITKEKRAFSPHLTIARIKKLNINDKNSLKSFVLENHELDIGDQHIGELILKKSTLTPNGPIYENLLSRVLRDH